MISVGTVERELPGTAGSRVVRMTRWLSLAAAPSLVIMAFVCAASGNADPICSAGRGAFRIGSMEAMYLVMSVFHLPPWLRLFVDRVYRG